MTGKQQGQLETLIRQSFNPISFARFLNLRLDKEITDYVGIVSDFPDQIHKVMEGAEDEVWETELLDALLAERPRNTALVNFVSDFKLNNGNLYTDRPEDRLDKSGLEALINNIPAINPEQFIAGLMSSKRCVCRIQTQKKSGQHSYGTGFLIGPDLVLTNYHVVEHAIKDKTLVPSIVCKFDYEFTSDGQLNTGADISLAADPFLSFSEYGALDMQGSPQIEADWPEDKLDYALMKLNRKVGDEPFGINADRANPDENKRGWITPVINPLQYMEAGGHMIIIQHPNKEPVKIGFGFEKVQGHDRKGMRVRYAINTMGGSSGSPCFNKDFGWVALHNMGDPDWIPTYNQGIPSDKIVDHLKQNGIALTSM